MIDDRQLEYRRDNEEKEHVGRWRLDRDGRN